jgi:rhodanese-related sulfurtransferase
MKTRLGYEILIIVAFSTIAGLMYNAFVRDAKTRLPWLREEVVLSTVTDDDLFAKSPKDTNIGQLPASTEQGTTAVNVPTQSNTVEVKDTSRKNPTKQVSPPPQITEQQEQNTKKALAVTYQQVLRLNTDESVLFFDARNEHEFAEGSIPRAKNIFPLDFDKHIPYILGLPKDVRIVVFCGGGQCDLSHDLSEKLIQFGFSKVYIYLGGYTEWKNKQEQK